jgi:hypothetical protein
MENVSRHLRFSSCRAPCLTRGGFCNISVQLLLGLASAVTLRSKYRRTRRTRDHTSLSQLRQGSLFVAFSLKTRRATVELFYIASTWVTEWVVECRFVRLWQCLPRDPRGNNAFNSSFDAWRHYCVADVFTATSSNNVWRNIIFLTSCRLLLIREYSWFNDLMFNTVSYKTFQKLCKIWGFHGSDYEEWRLLGCYAVWIL